MNRLLKVKLPAFLLAMVMVISMVPVSFAASADLEETVEAGDEVSFSRSEFKSIYEDAFDYDDDYSDFYYLEFTDTDDFDEYGHFEATDCDEYWSDDLDESDVYDAVFYYYSSDVTEYDEYELDGLTFVADDNADDGTLTLEFTLYGEDDDDSVDGIMEIEIDGGSSSGDVEIEWEVEAGDELEFDADELADLYDEEEDWEDDDLEYIEFTDSTDLDYNGTLSVYDYYNEKYVTVDEDDLTDDKYYYSSNDDDDYLIEDLTYEADDDSDDEEVVLEFTMYGDEGGEVDAVLTITIGEGKGSKKGDISYEGDAGDKVVFNEEDFADLFEDYYDSSSDDDFSHVVFDDSENLDDCGTLYAYDYSDDRYSIKERDLDDYTFYYDEDDIDDEDYDYLLEDMYYLVDDDADDETVTLDFTLYGDSSRNPDTLEGTLTITIGDGKGSSGKGDITIDLKPGAQAEMDPEDFNDVFQEEYRNYDFEYLVFTDSKNLNSYNGTLYVNYGRSSSESFTAGSLDGCKFYYDEDDIGSKEKYAYALEDLSFVAASTFLTSVTLEFRAYYSSSKYVDGTVVINPKDGAVAPQVSGTTSILYQTTGANKVQIKANDFSSFLQSKYPGSTLQYVKLIGVPVTGGLYYNYYGASKYGSATRKQLTASTCGQYSFYLSPSALTQYALSELTYVPSGSNYAVSIPFTAYGTGSAVVSGTVTISVTSKAVPEVYGVITKGSSTTFPAPQILQAVSSSIGSSRFYGIRLLSLPSSAQGAVYVGTGTSRKADTSTVYSYAGSGWTISQLRFVPTASFTGNVEIPYAVCDSSGNSLGVGKFSLGVVSSQKKFKDVSASTWCYKYVSELSSAGVIDGYSNGSFKPDSKISYGAALKLIMLAAGYPEQAPTVKNSPFSGYLAKARADGIITSSNVNLGKPITRLQVSQLAAGALKLNTSKVSSLKPFTDTSDRSVQALYEAGIVEGYFNNGTSTFKPNNTLTRGQVSAIVWRMEQYRK